MISHVQRLGNSLVVWIPKTVADDTGLSPDDEIEITVEDGRIILAPLKPKVYSIEWLLARISPKNQHAEGVTGPAAGDEVW